MNSVDFARIAAAALEQAETLIPAWLPGGRWQGQEWVVRNPMRNDGHAGSFSINRATGKWSDFALLDVGGGDLISLFAYRNGLSQAEAAMCLGEQFGITNGRNGNVRNSSREATKPIGCATTTYDVRDPAGAPVAQHVRIDRPGRKKNFFWRRNGKDGLDGLAPGDLPFYGIHFAVKWPDDSTVVVVEGEKTADRLIQFGITALGTVTGASSTPGKVSLTPLLRFREIVIWPDHDEVGREHGLRIGRALLACGLSVEQLRWCYPYANTQAKGTDAADLDDDAVRDALDAVQPFPANGSDKQAADETDLRPIQYSDDALALRFAEEHRERLRRVEDFSSWYLWNGVRWARSSTLEAFDWALENSAGRSHLKRCKRKTAPKSPHRFLRPKPSLPSSDLQRPIVGSRQPMTNGTAIHGC